MEKVLDVQDPPALGACLPGRPTATVLLADDEESIRRLLGVALRQRGYRVLEAADGLEALRVAERSADTIDLLLTDIAMPVLQGAELSRRLALQHPETKVLFISGYPEAAAGLNGAFLQKPFTPRTLLRKVQEILDL